MKTKFDLDDKVYAVDVDDHYKTDIYCGIVNEINIDTFFRAPTYRISSDPTRIDGSFFNMWVREKHVFSTKKEAVEYIENKLCSKVQEDIKDVKETIKHNEAKLRKLQNKLKKLEKH